ncbi:hypothetical protein N7517_003224 [Penicillium concentricum]|uniref:Uncharacterized protein n=1 Tax=Penicillium concentricum TaxID=293559 RepID=A0A9W9VK89_9EURO|nr:uncharacterized protein N7517_003224 [Penicillium concentricum]KAJ5385313.1 hypothetical protein N7517_003224 [Penicillium concentricum]
MATLDQEPGSPDNKSLNNLFGAFGALLGYIGAEATTVLSFERLLWPQRFLSGLTIRSAPQLALLHPMGGPLHTVALKTMDTMFQHGLLEGSYQGHMLGTSFMPELGWSYVVHNDAAPTSRTAPLRNCIWARAFTYIGVRAMRDKNYIQGSEMGEPTRPIRAQVIVGHLTLSKATPADISSKLPFVAESVNGPSLRIFLGLALAEISGISVTIILLSIYQTAWALLWLAPLFLRFVSASFSLRREPLISFPSHVANDPVSDFEVRYPQSDGNFLLITGPPALVLQFTRHYGHPVRSHFREIIQLAIVIGFGSLFPIGLFCSTLWMPLPVQYAWLGYQIFAVLVTLVARYSHAARVTTTESHIAQLLGQEACEQEQTLLFGYARNDPGTIKASLSITYHARYLDGKEHIARLLIRSKLETSSDPGPALTIPAS